MSVGELADFSTGELSTFPPSDDRIAFITRDPGQIARVHHRYDPTQAKNDHGTNAKYNHQNFGVFTKPA